MAFIGRSTRPGRRQGWLDAVSDIRFVGHSGDDDTILHFKAPPFGEAAEQLYQQKEFWPTKPDPSDSGFDLLCDVVADVAAANDDSDKFDSSLLKQLAKFEHGLTRDFQTMAIAGHRYADTQPAIIHQPIIDRVKDFFASTPAPRRVRLVGQLDMIRASTQTFALKLEDGQEIRGVLVEGEIVKLAEFLRERVLLLGQSVFRPSGRLLRIDADSMQLAGHESSIWSQMPTPGAGKLDLGEFRRAQGPRSGVAAVIGHWPGDETDAEVNEALEEMS